MKLFRSYTLPFGEKISEIVKTFSVTEKCVFYVALGLLIFSTISIGVRINASYLVEVPTSGGSITEGVVGTPRFINPLLAISDADKDLTTLIYSGLLRATPEGKLIPDLASSYTISEDGLEYVFTLKDNIYFHDKTPITTEDVLYTVSMVQDPNLKSAKRVNWDGVIVEKINDKEIKFTLNQQYSPFLENTTLGILPRHIWKNASTEEFSFSQFNIEPVGSGPYKIKNIRRDSGGLPSFYTLVANKDYALGEPNITNILFRFYKNEIDLIEAYNRGQVTGINNISPEFIQTLDTSGKIVYQTPLPRVFGAFLNQNQATVFINQEVRDALTLLVDRDKIVKEIFYGMANPINSPLPAQTNANTQTTKDAEGAIKILEKAGWKRNADGILEKKTKDRTETLQFSISTSNVPELQKIAEMLKKDWEEIGARVELKFFETNELNQNVIRPRKYDVLLFGLATGRDMDVHPFWHSSQRIDPGLNVALYANIVADRMLERARTATTTESRAGYLSKFVDEINKDKPAIFLYSPDFVYITSSKIKNIALGKITSPSERFLDIHNWYVETEKVWKIFTQ